MRLGDPAASRTTTALRAVTTLELLVLAYAATLLFVVPGEGRRMWAWVTPPFNSRFIGAVYLAALVPLVLVLARPRSRAPHVVQAMILAFTTTVLVVMLCDTGRFAWSRPVTIGFWVFYVLIPPVSLVLLRATRRPAGRPRAGSDPLLAAAAAVLGAYAVGLLAAPGVFAGFWPWSVDGFHGRLYAAAFLAPAAALGCLRPGATLQERRAVAAFLVPLGVFAVAGLLITDGDVGAAHRVDFGAAGTLGFLALGLALSALGVALAVPRGFRSSP